MSDHTPYRLGLDVGTNSIGWVVLTLDEKNTPNGILNSGVRIFQDGRDPQSKTSLAVARREARSQRRRRDRYIARRTALMQTLTHYGLMPQDETERKELENKNPWEIRSRGVDGKLTLHELGRALFHLNQRRGFKSNRKTDKDDKESGKVKGAIDKTKEMMGNKTLGAFLYDLHQDRQSIRARLRGQGTQTEYDLYTERNMIEEEFDTLWDIQSRYHPQLTQEVREKIKRIMLYQRPLKPVEPGWCTLEENEKRAPSALPITETFRIYQEVNNLRIEDVRHGTQTLTLEQRNHIVHKLLKKTDFKFDSMRKDKTLDIPEGTSFNYERGEKRKQIDGNDIAKKMAHKDRFGDQWAQFSSEEQEKIIKFLLDDKKEENDLIDWLMETYDVIEETAKKIVYADLPPGYARLSEKAMKNILPYLKAEVIPYSEACKKAGYTHSDQAPENLLEQLPYYGKILSRHVMGDSGDPNHPDEKRYGKIANPTVHIGLNQLRKLINQIIKKHGKPRQVVMELARDLKNSKKQRLEIDKRQKENQDKNKRYGETLETELYQKNNRENRDRLRLWEELSTDPIKRCCVYTGKQISCTQLLSNEVEIEHIIPYSISLDNSLANKTVAMRQANRDKGRRTPYEAFGDSSSGYNWDDISRRAENLPKNKRWRFAPNARERFKDENQFLDRQLTDTQYLARISKRYVGYICNDVWVSPGRLTALLRRIWNLNTLLGDHNLKNRTDHRHHAIDAAVIAVTDRAMVQAISTTAGRSEDIHLDNVFKDFPEPWRGFREDLDKAIHKITVSHRPDHGEQGKLHEETAYGMIENPEKWDGYTLVYRKAFDELNQNEIDRIRDEKLRDAINEHIYYEEVAKGEKLSEKEVKAALVTFADKQPKNSPFQNIRRVRLMKKEKMDYMIDIKDRQNRTPYKAYAAGDNHCIEIYETPDGKWHGEAITVFNANQKKYTPQWRQDSPDAKFIMRVHKQDIIALDRGEGEEIMKVVTINPSAKRLYLALHNEGGNYQKRNDDKDDPFRWLLASFTKLKSYKVRLVCVDEIGRIRAGHAAESD